jgi:hypothetical protein
MAETRKLTLKEFLAGGEEPAVEFGARFNGGAFMDCHCRVFAETGRLDRRAPFLSPESSTRN